MQVIALRKKNKRKILCNHNSQSGDRDDGCDGSRVGCVNMAISWDNGTRDGVKLCAKASESAIEMMLTVGGDYC